MRGEAVAAAPRATSFLSLCTAFFGTLLPVGPAHRGAAAPRTGRNQLSAIIASHLLDGLKPSRHAAVRRGCQQPRLVGAFKAPRRGCWQPLIRGNALMKQSQIPPQTRKRQHQARMTRNFLIFVMLRPILVKDGALPSATAMPSNQHSSTTCHRPLSTFAAKAFPWLASAREGEPPGAPHRRGDWTRVRLGGSLALPGLSADQARAAHDGGSGGPATGLSAVSFARHPRFQALRQARTARLGQAISATRCLLH